MHTVFAEPLLYTAVCTWCLLSPGMYCCVHTVFAEPWSIVLCIQCFIARKANWQRPPYLFVFGFFPKRLFQDSGFIFGSGMVL